MIKLTKREIILGIIFFVSVAFFSVKDFSSKKDSTLLIKQELETDENKTSEEQEENVPKEDKMETKEPLEIKVDISGAVKKPGIVTLKEGDRVEDAILKAGGTTEKADENRFNRAKFLQDGEHIIIPQIGEEINIETSQSLSTPNKNNKININTATKDELTKLSGIGEALSERIIKYRQKNNGFKNIEEIMEVNGIGQNKFQQIKDDIKIK